VAAPKSAPLTFLITAGPTIEDIDPVRFISNRATGKLGAALARAAHHEGHQVILIHGPVHESVLEPLRNLKRTTLVAVRSASQMHRAVMQHFKQADVVIMNAAVADFTPANASPIKLKKASSALTLRLKPTVDILKALGEAKQNGVPVLIGFALETGKGSTAAARRASRQREALRKLEAKNLDAIVLDTPAAMGSDASTFTVFTRGIARGQNFADLSKQLFAAKLVRLAAQLLKPH